MFWIKYRCVAITSDAIYILEGSKFSGGAQPKSLVGTLPRNTRLGPVSRAWTAIDFFGETHWVKNCFYDQIRAANSEAKFAQSGY
jgi:hypothetical protein